MFLGTYHKFLLYNFNIRLFCNSQCKSQLSKPNIRIPKCLYSSLLIFSGFFIIRQATVQHRLFNERILKCPENLRQLGEKEKEMLLGLYNNIARKLPAGMKVDSHNIYTKAQEITKKPRELPSNIANQLPWKSHGEHGKQETCVYSRGKKADIGTTVRLQMR
jgi:hypothetical protein